MVWSRQYADKIASCWENTGVFYQWKGYICQQTENEAGQCLD